MTGTARNRSCLWGHVCTPFCWVYMKERSEVTGSEGGRYLALEDANCFPKQLCRFTPCQQRQACPGSKLSRSPCISTVHSSVYSIRDRMPSKDASKPPLPPPPPRPTGDSHEREKEGVREKHTEGIPEVQWSGLCMFTAGCLGPIPECGTETHQTTWCGQK